MQTADVHEAQLSSLPFEAAPFKEQLIPVQLPLTSSPRHDVLLSYQTL